MSIRNNLHTDHGLETYAQGMCNSAGDKARINQHLVPGTILEIGCGNGAYLQTLPVERLRETTAVDMNGLLLLKAQANLRENAGLVTFQRANVLKTDFFEGTLRDNPGRFNNIVLCSIVHELFSEYAGDIGDHSALMHVFGFINNLYNCLLAPGGRLIIRDGCKPDDGFTTLRFKNSEVRAMFAKFVDDHPWFVNYTERDGVVRLRKDDCFEFLTKYFYTENWNVEVLERFGWCSPSELVAKYGDQITHSESYTIPWLGSKWLQDFEFESGHVPDSTMLIAIQKPR